MLFYLILVELCYVYEPCIHVYFLDLGSLSCLAFFFFFLTCLLTDPFKAVAFSESNNLLNFISRTVSKFSLYYLPCLSRWAGTGDLQRFPPASATL